MEAKPQRAGDFIWMELASSDPAAARPFYEGLLDWTTAAYDMPFGEYLVFSAGDAAVGGAMAPDEHTAGQKTWIPYLLADDVDAVAARAAKLGGRVIAAPHDVPGVGRAALLADPGGARFALMKWSDPGAAPAGGPGRLCWSELVSGDPEGARRFYGALFGWGTRSMDMGAHGPYHLWQREGADHGGLMAKTAEWGAIPDHWMLYVQVDDVDARAARAAELGGRLCVPPTDIPGVGRFCIVDDPAGGTLSLLTFKG